MSEKRKGLQHFKNTGHSHIFRIYNMSFFPSYTFQQISKFLTAFNKIPTWLMQQFSISFWKLKVLSLFHFIPFHEFPSFIFIHTIWIIIFWSGNPSSMYLGFPLYCKDKEIILSSILLSQKLWKEMPKA